VARNLGPGAVQGRSMTPAHHPWADFPPLPGEPPHPGRDNGRPKQADILLQIADTATLYHAPDGTGYADLRISGHRETWPVRSKGFRLWLVRQYYERTSGSPSSEAMKSALGTVEAKAHFDGRELVANLRVAALGEKLYLDLADESWRAVEIDAEGWRIATEPPVRFRRAAGMLPLPEPIGGGSLSELHRLLNVRDERDFVLIVTWLLAALRDCGPYPVLALTGEHGSAKSSLAALLRSLTDPNTAPLRTLPRDDRDLFIAATNGHVIAIDNVSSLPPWLSDTLCRLATGGGFATRQLYSDTNEVLLDAMRPIILTGIEEVAARGDLADRSIAVRLEPILEERRRTEREIWAEFEAARPRILGTLLDMAAHGLRHLATTRLDRLPRMADFAVWATACEGALWGPGTFGRAYDANLGEMNETVIEADTVAMTLQSFMAGRSLWRGIAQELLPALVAIAGDAATKAKTWPATSRALSGRLRRAAPNLRRVGIRITFERRQAKGRPITIEADKVGTQPSLPSRPSLAGQINGFDDDSRVTNDGASARTVIRNPSESAVNDADDGCDGRAPALSGGGDRHTPVAPEH
jgi:hypothetical protein